MSYSSRERLRPIQIKFDLYTDAADSEFKIELLSLMITNLYELAIGANESWKTKNNEAFNKAAHKSKSAVTLLSDDELSLLIAQIKENFSRESEGYRLDLLNKLNELCESIIQSLKQQAALLRSQ